VFATYFPSQRIIDNDIIPRQSRKGLTPTHNTFPMFNPYQFFKKHKIYNLQFFRQQVHWLCSDTMAFVSLPGVLDSMLSSADQSARSGF